MNKRSIILLSGGLDSLVSLGLSKKTHNVELALFFDYAQAAFKQELSAVNKITKYYNIDYKIIELDWYKELISSNSVWVPNRNALFINIAACFADSCGYGEIIIGANKEEAQKFSDNSSEFINAINKTLEYSTKVKVKVTAPLLELNKSQIIEAAIKNNIPLDLLYSCYSAAAKHCGNCESCLLLKKALLQNHQDNLINKFF